MANEELEKGAWYLFRGQRAWLRRRAHALTEANGGKRVTESEVLRRPDELRRMADDLDGRPASPDLKEDP